MKLALHDSDAEIADLMTEGCNMGVKSLSKYLNQYAAADEASKGMARRLIVLSPIWPWTCGDTCKAHPPLWQHLPN